MQSVKRILLILGLVLCALPTHAAYVQSGKSNFATAHTTVCAPGTVTAGNLIVMAAQWNSPMSVSIASTRTTWGAVTQTFSDTGANIYVWVGVATSSGAESITVTLASGTAVTGSACAEYTLTNVNTSNNNVMPTAVASVTTTVAVADLVQVGHSGAAGVTTAAPYTERQSVTLTGSKFLSLGDQSVSSVNTYSTSFTGGQSGVALLALSAPSNFRHKLLQK